MTASIKDKATKEWKEVMIDTKEIFKNTEMPAKSIYVLGEAGSGKSMFCKVLVHFWCVAHSFSEGSFDKSDIVKEMGSFKYLFYVLLRHCSDCNSIEEMLEKSYRDPALGDILQNESSKCLIVLDGLDEWTPERKHNSQFLAQGLPGRELDANYTIITTSRQWKFDALQITDSEVDKKIKLRGISIFGINVLTEKTVKMLNDIFRKSKTAESCIIDLQRRPVSDIIHIPLVLQQLIFLWFDDKLGENSKCAIYSSMLALFLEWKALKSSENQECELITQACLIDSPLPDYLCQYGSICENTRVIQYLSHLAYETLFDKEKETTLTFSRSKLKQLHISDVVIKYCLNIGILTEEQNMSLHASICQQASISFFHKSMHEYLAAVFVASQLNNMMHQHVNKHRPLRRKIKAYFITLYRKFLRQNEYDLTAVCTKYFGSCETVVDILEQSNVFIMLCGLEPQLLTNLSEYIYNVAAVDRMVAEERQYQRYNYLIGDIQACIFRCINEVVSSGENVHTPVYIADLYISPSTNLVRYGTNIVVKNVLSIEVDGNSLGMTNCNKEEFYVFLESLTKCDQLKAMKVNDTLSHRSGERINNAVTKILSANVSTLETVSLSEIDKTVIPLLVSEIPKMRRLVSLKMTTDFSNVSDEVCLSLSKVLNQTTSLQHITLDIECENDNHHMVDLSEHKQLQHVDIRFNSFSMVNCNTDNLETCKLFVRSSAMMNQLCDTLYKACTLKHLKLIGLSGIMPSRFGATTEDKAVTENLIRMLQSLVSLSTLALWKFTFTDNIITCPSDMKNLKEIELHYVTMSMTTWCKFIDSLPALSQSVQVQIDSMSVRDETVTGYIKNRTAEARQYARKKANLFRVTRDDFYKFRFMTKKV